MISLASRVSQSPEHETLFFIFQKIGVRFDSSSGCTYTSRVGGVSGRVCLPPLASFHTPGNDLGKHVALVRVSSA